MVKLLVGNIEVSFKTIIFPDGTSQIWNIDDSNLEYDSRFDEIKILWLFENESEFMHVLQLNTLIKKHFDTESTTLTVPYLPYARQDKDVNSDSAFALHTFVDTCYKADICRIEAFDAHSEFDMVYSTVPNKFHASILNHDVVCYPDKGARRRYSNTDAFYGVPAVNCVKVRNQQTGEILGLNIEDHNASDLLRGKKILIVDDICDGGMTFIKVAETLKQFNVAQIDLAVSHGLFSKGRQVLHDAGITDIFTTNSLLRNPEGFKVW